MKHYIEFREKIYNEIKKELLGPGSEEISGNIDEEVITEDPLKRYTLGILYPKNSKKEENDDEHNDSGNTYIDNSEDNEMLDAHINDANQFNPSAMGISFYIKNNAKPFMINIKSAQYRRTELSDCQVKKGEIPEYLKQNEIFRSCVYEEGDYLKPKKIFTKKEIKECLRDSNDYHQLYILEDQISYGWIRQALKMEPIEINPKHLKHNLWKQNLVNGLNVLVRKKDDKKSDRTLITIVLYNDNNGTSNESKKCFFQNEILIESYDILPYDANRDKSIDDEEESLNLLYRDKNNYAIGHGCSVVWEKEEKIKIKTSFLPIYKVPQIDFDLKDRLDNQDRKILSMKNLSDLSDFNEDMILEGLFNFIGKYKIWIDKLEKEIKTLPDIYLNTGMKHIKEQRRVLHRILSGIEVLKIDEKAMLAFRLANRAMYMQRIHVDDKLFPFRFPKENITEITNYREFNYNATWRPFQLAFILLTLESIVHPSHEDRNIVDLIWFPTGGGKTEAYLGVTAFTIFYRRLKNPVNGGGVTVIMRYTLRLLTAQQFERASTLIAACELIRREGEINLGDEEISIGLWIGGESTPNKIKEAENKLKDMERHPNTSNPFQVLTCPWCNTSLVKNKDKPSSMWGYRISNVKKKKLILSCTEPTCSFYDHLPIKVVDEDIYHNPPTLLFSTVDKFANLPWDENVANLFALNPNNTKLAPELIIQDELHLISGPLGTLVGLYETAIDVLSSAKGVKPKIIASTATIRRAKEQVKGLYDRSIQQFPPVGLNIKDSFFSREDDEKPGRLYVGLMSSGKTQTTTEIRLIASLLHIVNRMEAPNEIKDKFWTMLAYFNSIRELGKAKTLAQDDIKDHIKRLYYRRHDKDRKTYVIEELTSRISSDKIPKILAKLNNTLSSNPIDILLASNMISVGIDISRLSLMVIVGQPKTTSEYIQASSRVGRSYPGIIFTLYDGSRPRDRSHFEHFVSYHQSFYKFVEPTSVTPFSEPAIHRGLHAVLVSLVRHLIDYLRENNNARGFNKNDVKIIKIKELILQRVRNIDSEEVNTVTKVLNAIINDWDKIRQHSDLVYYLRNASDKQSLLYSYGDDKLNNQHYPTLRSLRNVDKETFVEVKE